MLSKLLYNKAKKHQELEAVLQNLSITTFRYIPINYEDDIENKNNYLNKLNKSILNELQAGGEAFLSNAIIDKHYCLRACFVNFRTSEKDINEIIDIIVKLRRKVHLELQKTNFAIFTKIK